MNFEEILEAAKKASGAASDSDLSRKLGVSRQAVSSWRNGVKLPDTVTCATIAGVTGIPLAKVLGIVGEARAISREEKAVWRKLAATAATLLCAIGLSGGIAPEALAHKAFSASTQAEFPTNVYYVQRRAGYYWDLAKLWLYGIGRRIRDSLSRHMEATA